MHLVSVIDTNLTKDKITQHGFHMNSTGKERIAKTIRQTITLSTSWHLSMYIKNSIMDYSVSSDNYVRYRQTCVYDRKLKRL